MLGTVVLLGRLRGIPTPEGGPPVRDPSASGGFGGFGGMGGGGFGKASMKAQLLEGLQQSNRDFQSEQVDKLQDMYQAAPSAGVEAQDAF